MKITSIQQHNKTKLNHQQRVQKGQSSTSQSPTLKIDQISSHKLQGAYGLNFGNALSFTSTKIYDINLKERKKDGSYKLIPASFSKIEDADLEDLRKMAHAWKKEDVRSYSRYFLDEFREKNESHGKLGFYSIEKDNHRSFSSRTTGLMMTREDRDFMKQKVLHVVILQANPKYATREDEINASKLKGTGELAIYGAVKLAKESKCKSIEVFSTKDSFYEHLGFQNKVDRKGNVYPSDYKLKSSQFDSYIQRIEEKYNIKN